MPAFVQKIRERLTRTVIPHAELSRLLFGQQHMGKQRYFETYLDQAHTIELPDFPHTKFLQRHVDQPDGEHPYSRYLAASWSYEGSKIENTPENRRAKIQSFVRLFRDIERGKQHGAAAIREPLKLCRRPDGRIVIVDGNHRAACAFVLGLDAPVVFVRLREQLERIARVPDERFGSKRLDRPYQSVFHRGEELVRGRRRDVLERSSLWRDEDLRGRSVLDLGCNYGVSSFLAAERGATRVLGLEYSPLIASAAARLNAYLGHPCRFVVHDLNHDLDVGEPFDTVFCFSVVKHLQSTDAITALIRRATRRVLYFECHARSTADEYRYLLNTENFRRIEPLGFTSNGAHSSKRTRAFYRCEV
jgi:hypothetical protein